MDRKEPHNTKKWTVNFHFFHTQHKTGGMGNFFLPLEKHVNGVLITYNK